MYQKRNKEMAIISLYTGDYNARFYLREIAKLANLPLKTCQDVLVNLEKEKILKSKTEGKNKYFSLNLDNINVKSELVKAEIYRTELLLEKYPEFKTFLKAIDTNFIIILFGSFAKLKADKNSDVDLFIVTNKKEKLPYHLLPHKIHENVLKEESFRKSLTEKEPLIKEIESNHIILNNHSSYVNIFWGHYGK
jgi:predicted nucleotidyltransferase/predicted transcriptional regulator